MREYSNAGCFSYRLICATLSGQSVRFRDLRTDSASPGLLEEEVSLLSLLESVSNGCLVEIHATGCLYKPGLVVGGAVTFRETAGRNLSFFLEPLIVLGLFGKQALSVTLEGITHDAVESSVDILRTVTLPIIARFCDIEDGLELKVLRRGTPPEGGGKVQLVVPVVRQIPSVRWTDEGMVKRIRGVAYALKVSPQFTNKMVDAARGVLSPYLADVYIFTDAVRGKESGNSPGYGIHLVAETTTGCLLSAEAIAQKSKDASLPRPEDIGQYAAASLLEEIQRGGVVDGRHQSLLLLLCALGPELISEVRLGPLTPTTIETLRLLRDVFGVVFSIQPEKEHGTVFLSCVGIGMKNIARKTA